MRKLFLIAAIAGLMASPASATVIYSNFGPGHTYSGQYSWGYTGAASIVGSSNWVLAEFTPAADYSLGQIDLALNSAKDGARVRLWSRSGALPDMLLGSWLVGGPLPYFSSDAIVTIDHIAGINLVAGNKYDLEVGPVDQASDVLGGWNWNSQGATGVMYFYTGGFGWGGPFASLTLPAFDVLGSVPEPSTLVLCVTAGACFWRRRDAAK